jgi:SAM-dependent methyltransferase
MSTWTSGYIADLDYTYGFYRELTPELLRFVALVKGIGGIAPGSPQRYCELGCGQGFSANLIAAANPQWEVYATDFNPAHIAGAQSLAAAAGTSNLHFFDHSFAEFLQEPSLPQFDIICLHGIYSWIAVEHRRTIVEFIRTKLKPGGLVYISYNCLPGWSAAAPMRHLMYLHSKTQGGPTSGRIGPALAFVAQLIDVNAAYFQQNASLAPRFERLKAQNPNYLGHEYFNDVWTPLYFSDVASELGEAKLSYVGSAALLEHLDVLNLSEDQQKLLGAIADPIMGETVRDYLVNQQFRRDVYSKGAVPLSPLSSQAAWQQLRVALSTPAPHVPLKVICARGEAKLQSEFYGPLLDALATGPKTVQELIAEPAIAKFGWQKLQQSLMVLVGAGHLQPALTAANEPSRRQSTQAFNAAVIERARASADLAFLASPVTGGGVQVDRINQLFLLARREQQPDPAKFVWAILNDQGQSLMRNGKAIVSPAENIAELQSRWEKFTAIQIPILQQLGIV